MTIAERINLHRCGYTKEEINQLAEAEKAELETVEAEAVEAPAPAPTATPEQPAPATNDGVLDAIKELTKAIYSRNINATPQPAQNPVTIDDLIKKV